MQNAAHQPPTAHYHNRRHPHPLTRRLRGIKLGDFTFSAEGLQLGQLRGNRFRLVLRDVKGADESQVREGVGA